MRAETAIAIAYFLSVAAFLFGEAHGRREERRARDARRKARRTIPPSRGVQW